MPSRLIVTLALQLAAAINPAAAAPPEPTPAAAATRGAVSVRDFGAKGDGESDDYPAIQAAIDAATFGKGPFKSGPAVYFPPGTYRSSRTIELKKTVRLFGDGSGLPWSSTAALVFPPGVTGIVVHRAETIGSGREATPTTGGDGSIIEGLRILGSKGARAHGIWLRARALLRNDFVSGFSGNCIQVVASARTQDPAEQGNANSFRIESGRVENCGENGLFVDGADANAGYVLGLDASSNGAWGIFDSSFLGNTYVACHTAANKAGPYQSDSRNARNVFLGCYSESGQPPSKIITPSIVVGGLHGAGFAPDSTAPQLEAPRALDVRNTSGEVSAGVTVNGNVSNGDALYLTRSDVSKTTGWRLRWASDATGDLKIDWGNLDAGRAMTIRGPNTRSTAGRKGPVPYAVNFPRLLVGDGGDATTRLLTAAPSAPTAGEWARGDVVLNVNAEEGGFVGWVCTKGGMAGKDAVFKRFGAIER
jgi:hypothetical protein